MTRFLPLLFLPWLLPSCASPDRQAKPPALLGNTWRSCDGKHMPFTHWGTGVPRAVVVAVHGLSGASSDFWLAGDRLAALGIHLYALDLRGQGRDPVETERGDIRSPSLWRRDLHTFSKLVQERCAGIPLFWMGESLGSLIVLHTAAASSTSCAPDGLILTSPVAGLRQPLLGGKRWLLEAASLLMPRKRVRLGDLAGVDESKIQVTSSTTHGGQMAVTPHHVSSFSVRLLTQTGRMMDHAPKAARRWHKPLLVLASPHDVISTPAQIEALHREFASRDKTLRWYHRSRHLLLHDVQREEVVADLAAWIEARLSSPH